MGIYKRDRIWYIDYYDQLGRRHREVVGPNKRAAEQALAKRKTEVAENKFLDRKKQEKIRFEDFADIFIESYSKPNKRSWKRDVTSIKKLKDLFARKYLQEITPLDIEKYKQGRMKEVSKSTINRELACLKTIFNKAIEWDKLEDSPARKIKLLRENNSRVRYLTQQETKRLLKACPNPLRSMIVVALNTGMRRGEIFNLEWTHIDFNQEIIYILDSKSGEKREVPMNETVQKVLLALRRIAGSHYVFPGKKGRYTTVKTAFHSALRRAGIENFRFHDVRHTFASNLVMRGINLKTVQELLGHKTFTMTLRYAHLSPDHKRAAVDILCAK